MLILYSAGLFVALLVTLPYWLVKMLTTGKYRAGLGERLGQVPERVLRTPPEGCIWVHAVSVGEVLAIGKLVEELRARYPRRRVLVSTTTAAGQKLARERHGEENVFFFPLDFAFAIRSYLRALRPALVILAETEFWPNFLRLARSEGARLAVVNARISDRSYPRYLRLRSFWRRLLPNIDLFLPQSELDSKRLAEIGAPPERVRVAGNLKFDVRTADDLVFVETFRQQMRKEGVTGVVVCGSTAEGEEAHCLNAFSAVIQLDPRSLLILAPRSPERFAEVFAEIQHSWSRFNCWKRSTLKGDEPLAGGILLLDTIGELRAIYELATIAFVGGSLLPVGGHNILEPAQFGVPVLVGPHTENFRDMIALFRRADALTIVDAESFAKALVELLREGARRKQLGDRARQLFESQSGATARTMAAMQELLPPEGTVPR